MTTFESSKTFYVVQDDLVIKEEFDSLEKASSYIAEMKRRDELSLMFKRKLLKKILKKSLSANLHDYRVFSLVQGEKMK